MRGGVGGKESRGAVMERVKMGRQLRAERRKVEGARRGGGGAVGRGAGEREEGEQGSRRWGRGRAGMFLKQRRGAGEGPHKCMGTTTRTEEFCK